MRKIICIGDSHTWGQGAGDFWDEFIPPLRSGEHRQIGFDPPCYTNLLREFINRQTNSHCSEITKDKPATAAIEGDACVSPYISITKGKIITKMTGSMFRLQFKCGTMGTTADIYVDGKLEREICTYSEVDEDNYYKLWIVDNLPDKEHVLSIEQTAGGRLDLYRADCYGGTYSVINSGVGSCSTTKYLDVYWQAYVEEYKPYMVIVEGFSINDWISETPLKTYTDNLVNIFNKVETLGGKSILLAVSPVLGKQVWTPGGIDYREYVRASIEAAYKAKVPVADAFAEMTKLIPADSSEEAVKKLLFADDWHVNNLGHRIYFECIRSLLGNIGR